MSTIAHAAWRASFLLSQRVSARPPAGLVVIDGMTGSGKTTLATAVVEALRRRHRAVVTVDLDRLVPGWNHLAQGVERAAGLLRDLPVAAAATWDWQQMVPSTDLEVDVRSGQVLVLEGCGALAAAAQDLSVPTVRVLVEAPPAVRHARLAARDPYEWDVAAWERQERRLRTRWQGQARWEPDLVVPTTGG